MARAHRLGGSASETSHRTTEKAPELARAQASELTDLRQSGIVDVLASDRPDPGAEDQTFAAPVVATAVAEVRVLSAQHPEARATARAQRWSLLAKRSSAAWVCTRDMPGGLRAGRTGGALGAYTPGELRVS